jgi:hypothetical protein
MKNIHVLPTNKPSLLFVDNDDKKLRLYKAPNSKYADNIYITNDEEIKEGDYGLGFALGIKGVGRGLYVFKQDGTNIGKLNAICNDSKKIILTTDQDLIADGVQAIDDEFLEWFVNNPSCEEVGVEVDLSKHNGKFQTKYGWKIIIPKEEPKQEIPWLPKEVWDKYHQLKQETLEEAAERIYREYPNNPLDKPDWRYNRDVNCFKKRKAFIAGAKWQQEQIYNQIKELYDNENITGFSKRAYAQCLDIIEQFKKK